MSPQCQLEQTVTKNGSPVISERDFELGTKEQVRDSSQSDFDVSTELFFIVPVIDHKPLDGNLAAHCQKSIAPNLVACFSDGHDLGFEHGDMLPAKTLKLRIIPSLLPRSKGPSCVGVFRMNWWDFDHNCTGFLVRNRTL